MHFDMAAFKVVAKQLGRVPPRTFSRSYCRFPQSHCKPLASYAAELLARPVTRAKRTAPEMRTCRLL